MYRLLLLIGFSLLISIHGQCLPPSERLDCHPDQGPSQERCEARGCCWASTKASQPNVPSCSFPNDYGGYRTVNVSSTDLGLLAFFERVFPSSYPDDVNLLRVDVVHRSDSIVQVKISDATKKRFEPSYPKILDAGVSAVKPTYRVNFNQTQTGFSVSRLDGGDIFNSLNVGALIFANQFLEISSTLENGTRLYGIGEHRTNLTLGLDWQRYTIFNHDVGPTEDTNLYGSHPFFIATNANGRSHGVFLHNSNAMDILISPKPAVTLRAIGGVFDFYFFLGPTAEDVVKQYTSVVGRTFLPPYWGLGFHLCRYGYGSAENTRAVWERNRALGIPYDVQWNDIDYMTNQNDFTINKETYSSLPQLVDDIHAAEMKYIIILDPGVAAAEPEGSYPPYDLGISMDVLIKNKNGSVLKGKAWNPGATSWPDFTHPLASQYWTTLVSDFHELVPFDGIWLDMNEPSNFIAGSIDGCPADELENPPYSTGIASDKLSSGTLCMNAQQAAGSHYDVHNLYSISQSDVTYNALKELKKRPFVLSRSTFSGSGRYAGHWSGDDVATWYDLVKSVQELLVFNIYGIPFMGADICGFRGNTNQNLCNRWFQLGAFYTFCRNHNDLGLEDQDPAVYDNKTIASIKKSLETRYTLLPYLYTLFYYSHVEGSTVARPLFFEFPNDPRAYDVELAFMWGSALYIVPVLEDGVFSVKTYLPQGKWYDWYTGTEMNCLSEDVVLDAPYDTIPVLVRGGSIIPTQAPAVTTALSRKNGITLVVAYSNDGVSTGSLYWDDGEVIDPIENNKYGLVHFSLLLDMLSSTVLQWTTDELYLEGIRVLGCPYTDIPYVTVTTSETGSFNASYTVDSNNVLSISNLQVPLSRFFSVVW